MNKYYTLIGRENTPEPWLITYQDIPPQLPVTTDLRKVISSSRWPILFAEQIPKRLLEKNPGFPILLRQSSSAALPNWVYHPLKIDTHNSSGHYGIFTKKKQNPKHVLFVTSIHQRKSWSDLTKTEPDAGHFWIHLGSPESKPLYPPEQELDLLQVIYFAKQTFDKLVDLDFGKVDTYTPIHLHCLKLGAELCLGLSKPEHSKLSLSGSYEETIGIY